MNYLFLKKKKNSVNNKVERVILKIVRVLKFHQKIY